MPGKEQKRRAPGEVRDAIADVFKSSEGTNLKLTAIAAGVEERLGEVPKSSVRSYLILNCKPGQKYKRVKPGVYRLR